MPERKRAACKTPTLTVTKAPVLKPGHASQKWFWTSLRLVRFPPPSCVGALSRESPVQKSKYLLSGPISRDIAVLSLRYPISRDTFQGRLALPQNGAIPPPWHLVSHRRICAIPHFATYRAIIVRYPTKTSTKVAASIP